MSTSLSRRKATANDITVLPAKFCREVIDHSWWAFCAVAEGCVYRQLHNVVELEEKAERQHRSGRAKFALSVNHTARMFVMQHVLEAPTTAPDGWDAVCDMAPQIVLAYGLAARLRRLHSQRPGGDAGVFGDVVAAISERTGTVNRLDGSAEVRLMQASRLAYNEPIAVPYIVAIDYARDIART